MFHPDSKIRRLASAPNNRSLPWATERSEGVEWGDGSSRKWRNDSGCCGENAL